MVLYQFLCSSRLFSATPFQGCWLHHSSTESDGLGNFRVRSRFNWGKSLTKALTKWHATMATMKWKLESHPKCHPKTGNQCVIHTFPSSCLDWEIQRRDYVGSASRMSAEPLQSSVNLFQPSIWCKLTEARVVVRLSENAHQIQLAQRCHFREIFLHKPLQYLYTWFLDRSGKLFGLILDFRVKSSKPAYAAVFSLGNLLDSCCWDPVKTMWEHVDVFESCTDP